METFDLYLGLTHSAVICGLQGRREESLSLIFSAENVIEALLSAERYAYNRLKNLDSLYDRLEIGSLKVSFYHIGPIDADGMSSTSREFTFEWKNDSFLTLSDAIQEKISYIRKKGESK